MKHWAFLNMIRCHFPGWKVLRALVPLPFVGPFCTGKLYILYSTDSHQNHNSTHRHLAYTMHILSGILGDGSKMKMKEKNIKINVTNNSFIVSWNKSAAKDGQGLIPVICCVTIKNDKITEEWLKYLPLEVEECLIRHCKSNNDHNTKWNIIILWIHTIINLHFSLL